MNRRRHQRSGRSGSVLILALWTLFFLAALAMAISAQVSAGLRQATIFREDLEAYAVARSGVAVALSVLVADTNEWDIATEAWGGEGDFSEDVPVAGGRVSVTHEVQTQAGVTQTNRGLVDAESRVSLNMAGQQLLTSVLTLAGGLDGDDAADVSSAILDWRDADDGRLTEGAENGYYATLSEGYTCHNRPFDAIEEVCLVKGCSRELLDRIRPVVTLFGSGKVNINTAGRVVLRCVAHRWGGDDDVMESVVAAILAFRSAGQVFESSRASDIVNALDKYEDLTAEESTLLMALARSVQIGSTCFSGTVKSRVRRSDTATATIDVVLDRARQEKVYWYER